MGPSTIPRMTCAPSNVVHTGSKPNPPPTATMADEDYLRQICELLSPFTKNAKTIGEGTDLVGDLGLTSLQVMELIEQIEDVYDISIPLNVLPQVRTIGDLSGQLARLLGSQQ